MTIGVGVCVCVWVWVGGGRVNSTGEFVVGLEFINVMVFEGHD
jgi:hypothetical protein